ncbi:MAG: iron ABC transporter permease [Rhizobiales bacterium]|nr:iron ABC transporter permease [Hyphomicrobiales bacterium]
MVNADALPRPLRRIAGRRTRHPGVLLAAAAICAVVFLPVVTLFLIALSGSGEDWPHLARNVLPGAARNTATVILLVSAGTALLGVATAWATVAYEFPLRRVLSWALALPLAVPPYLAAYAFAEFFLFSGPPQTLLRALFGFASARDYWFPDIRTTGGVALVMILVLYPYVYLTSRIAFLMQGRDIADVARTLGARPARVFFGVLLPVSRPAIVAGVSLVLMETVNDIGASEYLGVPTITTAVFTTWINRSSLEGAAQLAMVMFVLVFALLMAEQWARRRLRFHDRRSTRMRARAARVQLTGPAAIAVPAGLLLPVLLGFGVPLYVFADYASGRLDHLLNAALASALFNTVLTSGLAALLTVALALVLIHATRLSRSGATAALTRLAMLGYALPGTIVGLGLLFALARIDNTVDAAARAWLDVSTGLLLTGSAAAVVIACTIRFLALAESGIRSGLEKLPPSLDEVARSLGRSPAASAATVLLPLLRPAILTAAVLVFVDTAKELSATILLRPFGFNTLATLVYENASRAVVQEGSLAAIFIILTAMVPVILLSQALSRDGSAPPQDRA